MLFMDVDVVFNITYAIFKMLLWYLILEIKLIFMNHVSKLDCCKRQSLAHVKVFGDHSIV